MKGSGLLSCSVEKVNVSVDLQGLKLGGWTAAHSQPQKQTWLSQEVNTLPSFCCWWPSAMQAAAWQFPFPSSARQLQLLHVAHLMHFVALHFQHDSPANTAQDVASQDTTVAGSRNGTSFCRTTPPDASPFPETVARLEEPAVLSTQTLQTVNLQRSLLATTAPLAQLAAL